MKVSAGIALGLGVGMHKLNDPVLAFFVNIIVLPFCFITLA